MAHLADLLSTSPLVLYTQECALQVLRLPGTLTMDRSACRLWDRSRTMLTLAATYPRILVSQTKCDKDTVDLLTTADLCTEFRRLCQAALMLVNPNNILDIAGKQYTDHLIRDKQELGLKWIVNHHTVNTSNMQNLYQLCKRFYFGKEDRTAVAFQIQALDSHPYTTEQLMIHLARAMVVASSSQHIFDKLKLIFVEILSSWPSVTARLQSCVEVTLGLCGKVEPYLRTKLMASLLREVRVASFFYPQDFYNNDKNLLLLTPDLTLQNVYYAPDMTMVCNISRKCLGAVHDHINPDEMCETEIIELTNMMAYAVTESAAQINYRDFPKLSTTVELPGTMFDLKYVNLTGVPGVGDDEANYIDVQILPSSDAKFYGFAIWDKSTKSLQFSDV